MLDFLDDLLSVCIGLHEFGLDVVLHGLSFLGERLLVVLNNLLNFVDMRLGLLDSHFLDGLSFLRGDRIFLENLNHLGLIFFLHDISSFFDLDELLGDFLGSPNLGLNGLCPQLFGRLELGFHLFEDLVHLLLLHGVLSLLDLVELFVSIVANLSDVLFLSHGLSFLQSELDILKGWSSI